VAINLAECNRIREVGECPLSWTLLGEHRTSNARSEFSGFDPKQICAAQKFLQRKSTITPHIADRNFLF
jgi:hypothetical protein